MQAWHWIFANWGKISLVGLLILKWIYNAWTPDVTFSQFVRQFIGEVIQESPQSTALALLSPPERKAVLMLRAGEGHADHQ